MGDIIFDRVLAIGSGILGALLLAGAALQLREPVVGTTPATPARVADAATAAGALPPRVHSESVLSRHPAISSAATRPRIHVVVRPPDSLRIVPAMHVTDRRSTRVVPAALRSERQAAVPAARVALKIAAAAGRSPIARKPIIVASARRPMRRTDRLAKRSYAAISPVPMPRAVPAPRRKNFGAAPHLTTPSWYLAPLVKRPAALAKHGSVETRPASPHARKRTAVAPLPEPPVGYNPQPAMAPQTIDATTATSIATETSDEHVPSVIVFKRGR